jgi:hypothetical protein
VAIYAIQYCELPCHWGDLQFRMKVYDHDLRLLTYHFRKLGAIVFPYTQARALQDMFFVKK